MAKIRKKSNKQTDKQKKIIEVAIATFAEKVTQIHPHQK